MTVDQKALRAGWAAVHHPLAEPSHVELLRFERQILAYEAAKPVPASGGVERDAIEFINDLVHMQSGQGWSRAIIREAAAAFLMSRGIAITGHSDTSASFAALAASMRGTVERIDAGWQTIKDQCHEGSDSGFAEQAATELSEAIQALVRLTGRTNNNNNNTGWSLVPVVDDAWLELCERDDRTSPEEYPGMCLITHNELAEFMSRAALASSTPAEAEPASSPATTEGVRGEDWSYAFDSDTLRDRFGGSFMAAEPDENGNVAVLLSRADAHAIVAALSPAPAATSTSGEGWLVESVRTLLEADKRPILMSEDSWQQFKINAQRWLDRAALSPEAKE